MSYIYEGTMEKISKRRTGIIHPDRCFHPNRNGVKNERPLKLDTLK
jgi:hypothetical protein